MEWKNFTSITNVEKSLGERKIISFFDEIYCDGKPIMYSVVAALLKSDETTLLLNMEQSVAEYSQIVRRFGGDMNLAAMQNKICVLDSVTVEFPPGSKHFSLADHVLAGFPSTEIIVRAAAEKLGKYFQGKPFTIVLDGLTPLRMAGWGVKDICKFIILLQSLSHRLILRCTTDVIEKELSSWIYIKSDKCFFIKSLSTGPSKNAHGQILACDGGHAISRQDPDAYVFKATESSVLVLLKPLDSQMLDYSSSSGLIINRLF